jgi:predicted secreted protein
VTAMKWTSALAIFLLFWVMSAFLVMPFGVRNAHEAGETLVPGQADGAPANFNPKRILIRTTLLAMILFGIYYINYINKWISF